MENFLPVRPNLSCNNPSIYNAEVNSILIGAVDLQAFIRLSARVCALYGIALPDAQILKLIHEFVMEYYHWTTTEHFRIAFEMNAANKLDKKIEHYSAFSITFVGDVLTTYRPIRDKVNLDLQREKNTPHVELIGKDNYHKSMLDQILVLYHEDIERFKEGKLASIIVRGTFMMGALETHGIITADSFTDEEYMQAKSRGKQNIMREQNLSIHRIKNMPEHKRKEVRESMRFEGIRELYLIHLKKQLK
jgi:hypothetical protein